LLNCLFAIPVLSWNAQHGWITVEHVAQNAGAGRAWHPTLKFFAEFVASEIGLLNPIFFAATVWAAIVLWKRNRKNPYLIYFFSMGAPLFLVYLLWSFRSRVLPNWIAPAVVPLFCMMMIYWDTQWRLGVRWIKPWLKLGLVLGAVMVIVGHDTNLVKRVTGNYLPINLDPLHRVREWDKIAQAIDGARQSLLTEGKPVFIITDHYGIAGEVSFYLPEARTNIRTSPLVFYQSTSAPDNQFYFWPGYSDRKGQNAVYARELDRNNPNCFPPPERIRQEFESVSDLGVTNVMYHGKFLLRPFQLFACRGLR
jgi:undecaprenyl-diphosphatase